MTRISPPCKTTQRGYGNQHQKLRRRLKPLVEAGQTTCWRCGQRIQPGQKWDLGHDDVQRNRYRGPEHALAKDCPAGGNRATIRHLRERKQPATAATTFFNTST